MVGLVVGKAPVLDAGDLDAFTGWARARIPEVFPAGTVSIEGDEVGFWIAFASAADEMRWEVYVVWREPPDDDDIAEDEPRSSDTPRAMTFVTSSEDIEADVSGIVEDGSGGEDASFTAVVLALHQVLERLADEEYDPEDELARMLWLNAGLPAGWSDPVRFLARPGHRPEALDRDGAYADAARQVALAHLKVDVGAFIDTLDSEAFDRILEMAEASHEGWASLGPLFDDEVWKGMDTTFVDGAPLRVALEALPGLVDLLCQAWHQDHGLFPRSGAPDVAGLLKAVTGNPISRVPVAAALARLEARNWGSFAQRSGAWAVPAAGMPFCLPRRKEWAQPDVASIATLATYPDDTVPRTDAAWEAFDQAWPALALAGATLRSGIEPAPFAGLDVEGGWEGARRALASALGEGATAWGAVVEVPVMVEALVEQVLLPARSLSGPGIARPANDAAVARKAAAVLARRSLVEGRALAGILADHRAWSAVEIHHPGDKGAYEAVLEAWRPILPEGMRHLDMVGVAAALDAVVQEMGGVPPTLGERAKDVKGTLTNLFRRK